MEDPDNESARPTRRMGAKRRSDFTFGLNGPFGSGNTSAAG